MGEAKRKAAKAVQETARAIGVSMDSTRFARGRLNFCSQDKDCVYLSGLSVSHSSARAIMQYARRVPNSGSALLAIRRCGVSRRRSYLLGIVRFFTFAIVAGLAASFT